MRGLPAVEARLETEAVDVAVAVAKKLAAALIAREPLAEIRGAGHGLLPPSGATPACGGARQRGPARERAASRSRRWCATRGLAGRLVVLAEPDIATGDCRIEWADGGVNRDRAATEAAIDEAVARYVKARLAAASTP